jgi:hypothetical protein
MSLEKFKETVKAWEATSCATAEFGSSDTEPNFAFQWALRRNHNGEAFTSPTTAGDWQLFTRMSGVGAVARKLTSRLNRCLAAMNGVSSAEHEALKEYLEAYLWRC